LPNIHNIGISEDETLLQRHQAVKAGPNSLYLIRSLGITLINKNNCVQNTLTYLISSN